MMDESWRARDDLRTLSQAAEIGRDKKRLKAARTEASRQISALQTVAKAESGSRMSPAAARRKKLANVEL